MSLDYTVHAQGSLILESGSGVLSDADLALHFQSLAADERFYEIPRILSDLRGVEHIDLTEHGVRKALSNVRKLASDAKAAIVVPLELTFGLSRIYEVLAEELKREVRIFRDWHDALRWLGAEDVDLGH